MTQDETTHGEPSARAKAPVVDDLSAAIATSIDRVPGEQVRIVRLFGNCYRCNWWVEDKPTHPTFISAGRITRSRFLRATRTADQLVIEDLSRG